MIKKWFSILLILLISINIQATAFTASLYIDYTENINNAQINGNCEYYSNTPGNDFITLYHNTITSVDSNIAGIVNLGVHTDHASYGKDKYSMLREIASNAFTDCKDLKGVILGGSSFENAKLENNSPDAVFNTIINSRAFYNCTNLQSIFIGGQEFYGSTGYYGTGNSLPSYKIYNTEINWGPFYNCPNLKYIIIEDENAVMDGLLSGSNAENVTIYCKSGSTAETYAKFGSIPYVLYDVEPTEEDLKTFNADCYAYNYPELAAMLDYNENLLFANYRSEGEALGRNASTYNMVLGDADTDSTLTAADAAIVLQKVLDNDFTMPIEAVLNDDYMSVLDADTDGMLTAADAAAILQKVLDNDYKMPIEG